MLNWLKKESKILAASLCIGVLFAFGVAAYTYVYSVTTQRDIAQNVIRFHVMAHSDCAYEQELKYHVRTEILEGFTFMAEADITATRESLREMLPSLQSHAENAVRNAGFPHGVSAAMTNVFFPTTFYGSMAFPPGNYEAVQIIIGDGAGQNWWCLMFPPLCYVDMTATEEGRAHLSETVGEAGFQLLTHQEDSSPELIVRFRVVEWWQNLRQPDPPPPYNPDNQQHIARR
ncbi:MAG: stage II sporulation protein R [Defluviitaleaceae bacterium]|nr:stage II sporulation protein R [Defluviitaleaceae bacterium]